MTSIKNLSDAGLKVLHDQVENELLLRQNKRLAELSKTFAWVVWELKRDFPSISIEGLADDAEGNPLNILDALPGDVTAILRLFH